MLFHARHMVGGIILAAVLAGCGQTRREAPYAITLDVIECRGEYERECLHFYEQNWEVFREEALERNYISGYQILRTVSDSAGGLTLILVTEYPDSLTFAHVEENFQPLMRELRPDGPSLRNDVPRSAFVANRLGFSTRPLHSMEAADASDRGTP